MLKLVCVESVLRSAIDLTAGISSILELLGVIGVTGRLRDLYHATSLYPNLSGFPEAPATAKELAELRANGKLSRSKKSCNLMVSPAQETPLDVSRAFSHM